MFYDDYDLDYTQSYDHSYDLDEMCEHTSYNMQDTYDLDEDYARDTYDYNELAYRHYAWYNLVHIASRHMLTHAKRLVRITLDVECYDDFHPEDLDWNDILDLEGDENVDVTIKDYADIF